MITIPNAHILIKMPILCLVALLLGGCADWSALRFTVVRGQDAGQTAPSLSLSMVASTPQASATPSLKTQPTAGKTAAPATQSPLLQDDWPAEGRLHRAACEQYLTLRKQPDLSAGALQRVPKGALVAVHGFTGKFARVTVQGSGRKGYLLAGYLTAVEEDAWLDGLDVVKPVQNYSHSRLMKDLKALARKYPGRLRLETAGATPQGREIPVAVLGNPDAPRHVLIQAGIHGREHMTGLLVMAQLEYSLKYPGASYEGKTAEHWLTGVCLHILPMANPDGVTISQKARMTPALKAIYNSDRSRGYTSLPPAEYLAQWKANGAGVDLNRNFDAGWQALESRPVPSASHYKGESPADQGEAAALAAYTRKYPFAATVSYHASNSCIYWQYGQNNAVNAASRALGMAVGACTGYPLEGMDELDSGGYKDWAIEALGIPSITVEIGVRPCPLPLEEFSTIWQRNRNVFAAVARWAR